MRYIGTKSKVLAVLIQNVVAQCMPSLTCFPSLGKGKACSTYATLPASDLARRPKLGHSKVDQLIPKADQKKGIPTFAAKQW